MAHGPAMPKPATGRGGSFQAWFWAFVALAILACAAYWLTRTPDEKKDLRDLAADKVNDALDRTPLAGMGDILREVPPPPPIHGHTPPSMPGTLSGKIVRGGVGEPPEPGAAGPDNRASVYFSSDYVGPVREDPKVRPAHVSDIAHWLADRFKPGPDGGNLLVSVQALNARGGAGLAAQATGGRAALLRYAFHPAMIEGLYRLYIDRFMDDLNLAARTRGFSSAQNRQFHLAIAGQAAILAQALEGVAAMPDLSAQLARMDSLADQSVDLNSRMGAAVAELDQLRKANANAQQQQTTQMRVDGLVARYRRSVDDLDKAKRNFVAELRKLAGQGLDDDALLYVASWVERRVAGNSEALAAVNSAAGTMRDLARRCAESGG